MNLKLLRDDQDPASLKSIALHCEKNNPAVLKNGQNYGLSVEKLDSFCTKYDVQEVCMKFLMCPIYLRSICSNQDKEDVTFYKILVIYYLYIVDVKFPKNITKISYNNADPSINFSKFKLCYKIFNVICEKI